MAAFDDRNGEDGAAIAAASEDDAAAGEPAGAGARRDDGPEGAQADTPPATVGGDDAASRVREAESLPLGERAEAYLALHDELLARLDEPPAGA